MADQKQWSTELLVRCKIPLQGKRSGPISRDEQQCVIRALNDRTVFLEHYHRALAEARLPENIPTTQFDNQPVANSRTLDTQRDNKVQLQHQATNTTSSTSS